ncbi:MAG: hypothetical protein A2096_03835 [Spirochaetes bacterium GWF1_41_5]|nr:MAG: hypothetical protein A2096_03835 [Spirochaetes bacterium GWF1_41_5]HBE02605.1 hypothetical protein [Spirochaetia bacterium]
MKKYFLVMILVLPALLLPKKITKVGYIDIQKIINKVVTDQNLRSILENRRSDYLKNADRIAQEIQRLKERLNTEGTSLTEERRTQILEEITFKEDELKQYLEEANKELSGKESELTYTLLKQIYQYIKKTAQTEGYTIIMEKNSSLIFADDEFDITSKVIEELDKVKKKAEEN